MTYLVSPVYVNDEYIEPQPSFIVVPVTVKYIDSLIEKFNRLKPIEDLYCGDFIDWSADYIEYPSGEIPDDLMGQLETGRTFLTEYDLSDEALDLVVNVDLPMVHFYPSSRAPQCSFRAYIKHTDIEVSSDVINLEWALTELKQEAA